MTSLIGIRAGQKLGNYQLKHLIGRGSFAEVYLAEHMYLKTQVAVKVLYAQLAQEDQEHFLNEARTLARLKHPNILAVLEFGVEEGIPFLVMDYAPRGSLREHYPRLAHLTPIIVLPFIKQAAAALQYAHQQNIIHRDVKPENMLLDTHEELLLSDFGMSVGTQSSRTQNMADIAGTIAYMAPEQIRGQPGPASDQYSLGIVLYELLSGICPFHGSFSEIASQQVMAMPPPIKSPAVSPEVEAVILQALAKKPEQRFPGVQAFAAAFEQATLEVEGTFRAPTGWLPPGVLQQLQTSASIEKHSTIRENMRPTIMNVPTLISKAPGVPPKTAKKRLSRGVVIGLLALAVLIVISGSVYVGLKLFNAGQVNSQQQGANSTQAEVASWQNRYTQVTSQKPFFTDPLIQNMNGWDNGIYGRYSYLFTNSTYHSISLAPYNVGFCETRKFTNLGNISYQAQMTILRGNEGGILFHMSPTNKTTIHSYFFSVNRNGTYNLWAVTTNHYKTLLHNKSAAIKPGLNQSNMLTIIAQGKQIALYINKQYINSIADNSAATGVIGVFTQSLSDTTEVAFSNLAIWKV